MVLLEWREGFLEEEIEPQIVRFIRRFYKMDYIRNNTDVIFFIMEIIGTIAFSSSGAMTAFKRDMDIFGVNVLAIVTAVGGGCIRDLIIGRTPPVMFTKPIYAMIAMITCNLLFLIFYWKRELLNNKFLTVYEKWLQLLDAVGLGIFTVTGVRTGIEAGYQDDLFLLLFLGVITGVGGGVLRDILATQKPYILVKHIYACACLIGAALCILCWNLNSILAMGIGAGAVLFIRLLAIVSHWNLPHITREDA